MKTNASKIVVFIDDNITPFGEFETPVKIQLDTRKITDGEHILKIVSVEPSGKEGLKLIPFTVRNGPAISISGLKDNEVVDGVIPLLINAYSKGDQKQFLITGSESPNAIPAWIWIIVIFFAGWACYYFLVYTFLPLF